MNYKLLFLGVAILLTGSFISVTDGDLGFTTSDNVVNNYNSSWASFGELDGLTTNPDNQLILPDTTDTGTFTSDKFSPGIELDINSIVYEAYPVSQTTITLDIFAYDDNGAIVDEQSFELTNGNPTSLDIGNLSEKTVDSYSFNVNMTRSGGSQIPRLDRVTYDISSYQGTGINEDFAEVMSIVLILVGLLAVVRSVI